MLNKVILIGRIGKDPEVRYTQAGSAVCNFSVATEESWKNNAGERQKRTEWHYITAWGKLAEIVQQYFHKGQLVYVEGSMRTNEWTDKKSAEKRSRQEIQAQVLRMLERKNGQWNGQGNGQGSGPDGSAQEQEAESEISF